MFRKSAVAPGNFFERYQYKLLRRVLHFTIIYTLTLP